MEPASILMIGEGNVTGSKSSLMDNSMGLI